jgi:transcriptional regulator GlxA family with amidase domain
MNTPLNCIQNWPELAQQANWSVVDLSKLCRVSVRTLERHFLKKMRETPKVWLTKQRHEWARQQLQRGCSVKETASRTGYKYPSTFSREFSKHWGICPANVA